MIPIPKPLLWALTEVAIIEAAIKKSAMDFFI
jgi:hypothetical protein